MDPYRLIIVGMDPLRLLHLSQKLAQSLEEIALRLFRKSFTRVQSMLFCCRAAPHNASDSAFFRPLPENLQGFAARVLAPQRGLSSNLQFRFV